MPTKEYNLTEPIYPLKQIVEHYTKNNQEYNKNRQGLDNMFEEWWKLCVLPGLTDSSLKKPITRTINKIKRIKVGNKEYVIYYEVLEGQDYQQNSTLFTHTVGTYKLPIFKKSFDYTTNSVKTSRSGKEETIYMFKYSPRLIKELLEYAADGPKGIELLVQVGSVKYGYRGFFTEEEFINEPIEELARIARDGKGMFILKESVNKQSVTEETAQVKAIVDEPTETLVEKKTRTKKQKPPIAEYKPSSIEYGKEFVDLPE